MIHLRAHDLTMTISELNRTAGDPSDVYGFWISCRIDVEVPGFRGTLGWSALQAELRQFAQALDDLDRKVGTEASLSFESFVPGVSLHLSMNELGQIVGAYSLCDTHRPDSPVLKGSFSMDQSYLRPFADAVRTFVAGAATVAAASTDDVDHDDESEHVKEVYAHSVTVHEDTIAEIDRLVSEGIFANRSQAVQEAVQQRIAKIHRSRLARECAKLDPTEEQALADEGYAGERDWPGY